MYPYSYVWFVFTARRARIFYENRKTTLCDICEADDCGDICKNDPNFERYGGSSTSNAIGTIGSWLLVAVLVLIGRSVQM